MLIFEIPLLIESKLMKHFDVIVLVSCPKRTRMKRYLKKGGSKFLFNYLNDRQISENKKKKFVNMLLRIIKALMF